jgi:hypothetical protein
MTEMVELMIKSLVDKSSLISKVLVFQHNNDKPPSQQSFSKFIKNVEVEYFVGHDYPYNHALGLHECIDRVETDYLLLTDPDMIYQLDDFDKFYLDLYKKYDLNIIGATHCAPQVQAFQYFPTVMSCLLKRDTLPDKNFLKGKIKDRPYITIADGRGHDNYKELDGKYLIQSPIPGLTDKFPAPEHLYDVGCNLWLWNLERKGRWLSFVQTINPNAESTHMKHKAFFSNCHTTNHNNFNLNDDFGNRPLLLHPRIYWFTPTFNPRLESMKAQYEIQQRFKVS